MAAVTTNRDTVRAEWEQDVALFGAPPAAIRRSFEDLVTRYAEPVRRYHTLDHVAAVLRTIAELAAAEPHGDLRATRLAGWYHDVIYDPTAPDNEARSAAHAHARLLALGLPVELADDVARLIELTAGHGAAADDLDGRILIDADLAILGAPPAVYDRYAAAIRAEYAHVPDDAYRMGRAEALRGFAGRPRLFLTDTADRRFGATARTNLERELARLSADEGAP
jgi:predicted metal-dependent HD superfamily phosphohydrolase